MEFIADPGTAWCGNFDVFGEIVQGLKGAGATAIKPQVWPASVYKGHPLEREALRAIIDEGAIRRMKRICEGLELPLFFSVFSVESYRMVLWAMGTVDRVKISCGMNKRWDLIDAVLSGNHKQVLISVASNKDVWDLNHNTHIKDHAEVELLYCVPNYPTEIKDVNFKAIDELVHIRGFSDHTVCNVAAVTAAALGFSIIEKHVMLDAEQYERYMGFCPRFPDQVCASALYMFEDMVSDCKNSRRMAGYD